MSQLNEKAAIILEIMAHDSLAQRAALLCCALIVVLQKLTKFVTSGETQRYCSDLTTEEDTGISC
ncbi:MAG: hypothetical protein ACLR17_15680 [Enterobacteriaceae bacterium]